MNTEHQSRRTAATEPLEEAEAVCDEWGAAQYGSGITLPSLGVHPTAYADEGPRPLVELGRCTPQALREIAAALGKGQVTAVTGCRAAALGQRTRDESTGRIGTLMYVGDGEDPRTGTTRRLPFPRPEHGGREWTTGPDRLTVLPSTAKEAS